MEPISSIAMLDNPIRRRLYEFVVGRRAWTGRDEVAAALDLPRSVVVFHLDKLVGGGLLDARYARTSGRTGPGSGRPAKQYQRTERDVAVSVPDRRYSLAAELLARAIEDSDTSGIAVSESVVVTARRAGAAMGAEARTEAVSTSEPEVALEGALRSLGYEPRSEGDEVVLDNCPFHALAESHRMLVCTMNRELLGAFVTSFAAPQTPDFVTRQDAAPPGCCVRLERR